MKAALYAVVDENNVTWYATLEIRADLAFWFGQHRNPSRILMLDPAISFGQAIDLKQKLNKLQWNGAAAGVEQPAQYYRDMLRKIQSAALAMDIPMFLGGTGHRSKIQLLDCNQQQVAAFEEIYGGRVQQNEEEFRRLVNLLQGRSLLLDEVNQLMAEHHCTELAKNLLFVLQTGYLRGLWQLDQGIHLGLERSFPFWQQSKTYQCHRCGGGQAHMVLTDCLFCGTSCPYCEQCLTMGRSRYCSVTVSSVEPRKRTKTNLPMPIETGGMGELNHYIQPWGLSEIQAEASGQALQFMKGCELHNELKNSKVARQFLIWAVTGAGKTEMIFPMIHYMIARGGHVVIATPRRDVVLELKPRIEKAFSPTPVVTLYGGSEQRWHTGSITIATTHQLMRFGRAFDLVIIDELDAFPYHNNPMLEYAAQKVCSPDGVTILLSATPPLHLQKAAKRGQLPHVKVTARYHRHPLPVPSMIWMPSLKKQLQKSALDSKISAYIEASISRGAQVFVFVPKIYMVEPLTKLLSVCFPHVITQGTSSKDEQRAGKVMDFRSKQTRILVTTTILERGVTIPKSDVIILDADEPIFDAAALVQMAGRAGRSADDPAGHVYFAAKEKTRAQVEAIRQIKGMNTLARRKGYLLEKGAPAHGRKS